MINILELILIVRLFIDSLFTTNRTIICTGFLYGYIILGSGESAKVS